MKTLKQASQRRSIPLIAAAALTLALIGCGGAPKEEAAAPQEPAGQTEATDANQDEQQPDVTPAQTSRLDTLVLVNKEHALPDGWESKLDLVSVENSKGETVEIDRIAYDAFVALQQELEREEGITIELNSGYRSIAQQQAIVDEFTVEYGEDYVREFVAVPGHSEHHTGIALDAFLIEDGVPILTNEEIFAHQDTWDVIHAHLARHGFILRYLDGREDITGYTYEPWHYRYVGVEAAQEIMSKNITLEEYLGQVPATASSSTASGQTSGTSEATGTSTADAATTSSTSAADATTTSAAAGV